MGSLRAQQPEMPKSWEEPLPSGPLVDDYKTGPDSVAQPDVPKGKRFAFKYRDSKIFPGTERNILVYVPAQYKGNKPACVHVGLDSLMFNSEIVFDNLIHKGELPVIIGIGVSPGISLSTAGADPEFGKDAWRINFRPNRSYEFDGLNDDVVRMLVEEVLPEVEKRQTPDGLPILLSKDPNDRSISGASTSGIAAFTAAWERPDQFRRVFSAIGTFVGMRGGDRYPVLVRKTEPKPIRVFLQDGHHDQWLGGPEVGDWWISNVALDRALEFSGYDVKHAWGTGRHSGEHAAQIFPDAIRWLWRDWPEPIKADSTKSLNVTLKEILKPGEDWHLVTDNLTCPGDLAVDPQGRVYCRDADDETIYRLESDGNATKIIKQFGRGGPMAFGADGLLYAADNTSAGTIACIDPKENAPAWKTVLEGIAASQILVRSDSSIYATDSMNGDVWLVRSDKSKTKVAEGLKSPTGLAIMKDAFWFVVVESQTHWGYSYRMLPDGTLEIGQKYNWYHVPDTADDLGSGVCCFDHADRLFTATRMGIAIQARDGVPRALLPLPGESGRVEATAMCFGDDNFSTIYAISGNSVFKRALNVKGIPGWKAPVVPPKPTNEKP